MIFSEDELEEIFKGLDAECWQCKGSGKAELFNFTGCDICYGTGYQPTRAGVELLNFLGRHQGRMKREERG